MQDDMKNVLEKAKQEIGNVIQSLNSTTACFSGHRSQKLPWLFNEEDERCKVMVATLRTEIEKAIKAVTKLFCAVCRSALI